MVLAPLLGACSSMLARVQVLDFRPQTIFFSGLSVIPNLGCLLQSSINVVHHFQSVLHSLYVLDHVYALLSQLSFRKSSGHHMTHPRGANSVFWGDLPVRKQNIGEIPCMLVELLECLPEQGLHCAKKIIYHPICLWMVWRCVDRLHLQHTEGLFYLTSGKV